MDKIYNKPLNKLQEEALKRFDAEQSQRVVEDRSKFKAVNECERCGNNFDNSGSYRKKVVYGKTWCLNCFLSAKLGEMERG